MDSIIYNAITQYYTALTKLGYYKYGDVFKLLVLCSLRDFVYQDFRGTLTKEDYGIIEKALDCLYGSNCLIPYPDYLKMGRLHIGEMTELAQRVKTLEETEVLKAFDADSTSDSDIIITSEDDDEDEDNE